LERWFGIRPPAQEYQQRRDAAELSALAPDTPGQPIHLQLRTSAQRKIEALRRELSACPHETARARLRERYSQVLRLPEAGPFAFECTGEATLEHEAICTRGILATEQGIQVPLILLAPSGKNPVPVVIAMSQEGKARFLQERSAEIMSLLSRGVAVCLPDLRGCGETDPDGDRNWYGPATAHSSSELMLGRTQLGNRLLDLRAVMAFLKTHKNLDPARLALWGDSFAAVNPAGFTDPPLRAQPQAAIGEPLGGFLALLGALFEDSVRAVLARRTLASWLTVFDTPFVHLPHDFVGPGIVDAGDILDLAATLGDRPVALVSSINGGNRILPAADVQRLYSASLETVRARNSRFEIADDGERNASDWLTLALGR
jgi:hypothetical protein